MVKLIISVLIVLLTGMSFRDNGICRFNESSWECYLNDSLLIEGHIGLPDSIVVLSSDRINRKGVINFHLVLDATYGEEFRTSLFLASASGDKILVSEDKATNIIGHFPLSRLKKIADSTKAKTLELRCLFDGIEKPWRMFKFKIQN